MVKYNIPVIMNTCHVCKKIVYGNATCANCGRASCKKHSRSQFACESCIAGRPSPIQSKILALSRGIKGYFATGLVLFFTGFGGSIPLFVLLKSGYSPIIGMLVPFPVALIVGLILLLSGNSFIMSTRARIKELLSPGTKEPTKGVTMASPGSPSNNQGSPITPQAALTCPNCNRVIDPKNNDLCIDCMGRVCGWCGSFNQGIDVEACAKCGNLF